VLLHGTGLSIRLVFMLLMIRISGTAEFGQYSLLVAIEVVVIYVAGLEFHTFTTRRYAKHPTERQLGMALASHRKMLWLTLPLAAALTILALMVLSVGLDAASVGLFLVVILTGSISQELIRFMVLAGRPVHAVAITFVRGAAWLPLAVPFIAEDAVRRMLVIWALAAILATVWALRVLRGGVSFRCHPRRRYLLQGLVASRNYFVLSSATVIQSNLERFVLQLMLGPVAVGMFSFFQTLANTLQALVTSSILNVSLGPLLSAFGQSQEHRFTLLQSVLKRTLAASIVMGMLISAVAYPLILLIGKPEYQQLFWMLPALLFAQVVLMWTQPVHLALYGAHRDQELLLISVAALVLSLALNIALIDAMGAGGAIAAPVLGCSLLAFARWKLLSRLRTVGTI
jgi:O-antigen/teichoic acid export membrane protein